MTKIVSIILVFWSLIAIAGQPSTIAPKVSVTPNAPVINTKQQLREKVARLPFKQATYNRARAKNTSLPPTQALFQQNVNNVIEQGGWRICADNIHFCGCSGIIDCALMGVLNDMVDDT